MAEGDGLVAAVANTEPFRSINVFIYFNTIKLILFCSAFRLPTAGEEVVVVGGLVDAKDKTDVADGWRIKIIKGKARLESFLPKRKVVSKR